MAKLYGPIYKEIWTEKLILPNQPDLFTSLAFELSKYLNIDIKTAKTRMEESLKSSEEFMLKNFPKILNKEKVLNYYNSKGKTLKNIDLYSACHWHSLVRDSWALHTIAGLHHAMRFAEGKKVLEFGHGIGSSGIVFSKSGFDLTMGDVSPHLAEFVKFRFDLRNLKAKLTNLITDEIPENEFDIIVSFDVIEHIPDPTEELEKLHRALKKGGLLIMNIAFGYDPMVPEHVLHNKTGVLNKIRAMGFERIKTPYLQVFFKRELSKPKKKLYLIQDSISSLTEDAFQRAPKLKSLFNSFKVPEI